MVRLPRLAWCSFGYIPNNLPRTLLFRTRSSCSRPSSEFEGFNETGGSALASGMAGQMLVRANRWDLQVTTVSPYRGIGVWRVNSGDQLSLSTFVHSRQGWYTALRPRDLLR